MTRLFLVSYFIFLTLYSCASPSQQKNEPFDQLIFDDGTPVRFSDFTKDYKIVSFYFSSCKSYCLRINEKIRALHLRYLDNKKISFYSMSVDPSFDTAEVSREYAQEWRKNEKSWRFITGESQSIFNTVKNYFKVPGGGKPFAHSSKAIVYYQGKRIGTYSLFKEAQYLELQNKLDGI